MADQIRELVIEQEGVSDSEYEIKEIFFSNGGKVRSDDIVLEYESSKTLIELESKEEGFFYCRYSVGDQIAAGEVVALVSNHEIAESELESYFGTMTDDHSGVDEKQLNSDQARNVEQPPLLFTRDAQELVDQLNNIEQHISLQGYITKSDVIRAVASGMLHLPASSLDRQNQVVFIGLGGMIETAIQAAREQGIYEIVGILDPHADIGSTVLGIPVIGRESDAGALLSSGVTNALITFAAAGKRELRQQAYDRFVSQGFNMVNVIHPKAYVDSTALLGCGNLILEGANIGSVCRVGDNNYINVGSVLCHHSELSGNVHLAPNSIVAGNVNVGKNSLIGMGATIASGCTIGENTVVNNGVNIAGNIDANSVIRGSVVVKSE